MKIYIDIDILRRSLQEAITVKKLADPKTDLGQCFNEGLEVAYMTVDAFMLRLKGLSYTEEQNND